MKIIRHDPASAIPSHAPIMIGDVANQVLVGEVDSAQVRISSVTFRNGARNRFHRHSADQILVMEAGRIIERGSHRDLLGRAGAYAHMWALQQEEERAVEIAELTAGVI